MLSQQIFLTRHQQLALRLIPLLCIAACSRDVAGPVTAEATLARADEPTRDGPVLLWNRTARDLVSHYNEVPPRAARGYALLSVAQFKALTALRERSFVHAATAPSEFSAPGDRLDRAAVAGASNVVLAALFPAASAAVNEQARLQLAEANTSGNVATLVRRAYNLGRKIGAQVIAYGATDGADRPWDGVIPIGDGFWRSSAVPPLPPLLPHWGRVRPWLLRSGSELQPQPPPAFGSTEFLQALAEVRRISDNRTEEQLRIALFWADGAGTATPPGHWNEIAATLIRKHHTTEVRTASNLALLNMVLMDASISCWNTKYTHWLIRPSQADPRITTPVGLPNFPSYTSGHATFSGAAAEILGELYPAERTSLSAMAEEAAMSRLYGGIHYRFDNEVGLAVGRALARIAFERWSAPELDAARAARYRWGAASLTMSGNCCRLTSINQ